MFDGAYGAFLVTPYWEHRSPARELAEVENLISAAQAAGLQHVVWSTLEDTREVIPADDGRMPMIDGGYRVPHFDVKGGSADASRTLAIEPVCAVLPLGHPLATRDALRGPVSGRWRGRRRGSGRPPAPGGRSG
ncbi:NmrA family NAD(P)-binding protein [Dactylosporangium sp. CA-092794]|uniref:NmrA family NAD(P)-binding protein n=1 Tax=Dactylosporangium sp. CA-092794 TaxID=3239929 RepID=UPI003D8B600B